MGPLEAVACTLTVLGAGDALMHRAVMKSAEAHGSYGYLYEEIAPLVSRADLAVVNLETPLAPKSGKPSAPFVFNSPPAAAEALADAGFDVFSLANNHAFDQGRAGLVETLTELDARGFPHVGASASAEVVPYVTVIRGVRVGVLAFTDVFNANLNRAKEGPRVAAASVAVEGVRALRDSVDLVVVSVHWGSEYRSRPTKRQRALAQRLADAGADVVFGHHPHVLGPVELLEREGRPPTLVAYSLGNLVSNQSRNYRLSAKPKRGRPRDGALLSVRVVCDERGTRVVGYELTPLWTLNGLDEHGRDIRVVPLAYLRREGLCALDTDPKRGERMLSLAEERQAEVERVTRGAE